MFFNGLIKIVGIFKFMYFNINYLVGPLSTVDSMEA